MVFRNALVATLFSTLILDGCASSSFQKVTRELDAHPTRLVLVESPNNVDSTALRNIFAPGMPSDSDETRKLVQSGMAAAEARAMAEMQKALSNSGMTPVSSEPVTHSVINLKINDSQEELSQEQTNTLRALSDADALLRFRITDYGQTPRTWKKWVIGFEVVTTVGIAAIAYSIPKTRSLAGVYIVTETIEETAEAYAGFWALNKLSRPVRIEAELFDLRTGKRIWTGSSTGFAKVHLMKLISNIDDATRDGQLENATQESVDKLLGRLNAGY